MLDKLLPGNGYREFKYENGTNLCHFFRTLLLGSIVTILSISLWFSMAWTVLIMPWITFSAASIATVVLVLMLIVGTLVAVVVGAFSAPAAIKWVSGKAQTVLVNSDGKPSFAAVVASYLAGIKSRFCPTIRFIKENDR